MRKIGEQLQAGQCNVIEVHRIYSGRLVNGNKVFISRGKVVAGRVGR